MRAERLVLVVLGALGLAGCGLVAGLTRPEGDGGWSTARRAQELATRGEAAGVAYPQPTEEHATPAAPLTLADALALATRDNRRIAEAGKDLEAARERVWQARGRLLPDVTGSGRYARYTAARTTKVVLPPGLLPAGVTPPDVVVQEEAFGTLNGTLTVPLDLSGELRHALRAAQAGYRGEQARLWATTLDEQAAVVRGYFQLLETEHLRVVTEQRIAAQRRQLESAESRFNSGRLTKNELLVVQVTLRNVEQELVRRNLDIAEARWTLNRLIGLPVDAPTEVVDVASPPEVPPVDEALHDAWAHNPALVALVEEQQRLEATERSLVRSRLPRVSGGAAIDYSSATIVQPQEVGSGFVGFSWDLGTDGRREAEIAEARIGVERNRLAVEQEMRELEQGIRLSRQSVEERLTALSTAEVAVGQAEENLRIREQQFGVGRATSDDVLTAEAILAEQRAVLASALYQAHMRRAELQELIGLPVDGGSVTAAR